MKKFNLPFIFTLLFAALCSHAQAPTKIWDKTIGGSVVDEAYSIVATNDGGFVVVGLSNSNISGDKTEASKGLSDYWIVKLNSSGQKVWDKTIGGSDNDYAVSVIVTSDGGFVVAGQSFSTISGDKSEGKKGQVDYWIVKLNSTGQKVWDKTFGGGIGGNFCNSIVATSDGGFIVSGYSNSANSFDKSEVSKGNYDYWIVKLNSSGQKIWDKTIGGSELDQAISIIATSDGGFVVAGTSPSNISGDKSEVSKGNEDFWIVKLNSTGQKVWDKTIGGSGIDVAFSIITSSDGGFVIAGRSNSNISGDKSETGKGSDDYWIVKLNSSGQKIWDKTIGGSGLDQACSIIETSDGGFVVAGNSNSSISGDKTEAGIGNYDYWIVKLNNLGQKNWDKTIGGTNRDVINSIIATADGGFVIAGISSSGISVDKTEANKGSNDFWIVKLNETGNCPSILTPTGTITQNQKAATTVISTSINIIPNAANVTYQAGNYVQLNAGFVANSGAVFTAKILANCQ